MFSQVFLAMTEQEMVSAPPNPTAYMACHFSAGGTGISNKPRVLPADSILLLDDSMPVQGHDPKTVVRQLNDLVSAFSVRAVLLDFQREPTAEAKEMAAAVLRECSCAAVTPAYALAGYPVFLPPPPVNKPLSVYLKPWETNRVFLELAPGGLEITITESGSRAVPVFSPSPLPLSDNRLHCHYGVTVFPGKAVFTLSRSRKDLADLAREATELGVCGCVGLYQELNRL